MWSLAIDGRTIESFADMQRIVSASAGRTLDVHSRSRRRAGGPSRPTPALKQVKDGFGNNICHRHSRRQPVDGRRGHED